MMTEEQELGRMGEEMARDFFMQNGYKILAMNWKLYHLELDLIAENDEYLVFCEVKTRSSTVFGTPETFVTPEKQRKIIRAANLYMNRANIDKEVRLDIVSVTVCGDRKELHHLPDAFKPHW